MDIQKQFEKMHRNYMDDIRYKGFTYHTIYSDDTCIDDGLPFSYAYRRNDDSIYQVYFKPIDGWRNMNDASDWVNDWENDIHHIDRVTSSVSDSIDLLQQLY